MLSHCPLFCTQLKDNVKINVPKIVKKSIAICITNWYSEAQHCHNNREPYQARRKVPLSGIMQRIISSKGPKKTLLPMGQMVVL
jgi:hypothetical protein